MLQIKDADICQNSHPVMNGTLLERQVQDFAYFITIKSNLELPLTLKTTRNIYDKVPNASIIIN